MNVTSACPGCGAALQMDEQAEHVTCTFCGSHYTVDFSQASPVLTKSESPPPPQVHVPAAEDIFTPGQEPPAAASRPPDPFSNMPEQPFDVQFYTQTLQRLAGGRLWLGLAVALFVVFCLSCSCIFLLTRLIVGAQ